MGANCAYCPGFNDSDANPLSLGPFPGRMACFSAP